MSGARPAQAAEFSPRTVLALVVVGLVAFAGLVVLAAYAPELRTGADGRAHALSKSAVGFAGAPILMRGLGETVLVSRTRNHGGSDAAVVLTPSLGTSTNELQRFAANGPVLIVLPKWAAAPDLLRQGFVRKLGVMPPPGKAFANMLLPWSKSTQTAQRKGPSRPALRGYPGSTLAGSYLPLGEIDMLQTVSGEGWEPLLVDETGGVVLARARRHGNVWLLADPDLLNNQGLKSLDTARAGARILQAFSGGGAATLVFDVTLAGYERGRGVLRLMLAPPWLAATLIGVAAAVLMGLHGLARFGQPQRPGRAYPLGARALVDNAANLIGQARKEPELAPAYAAVVRGLVLRAAGAHGEAWLDELARRRGQSAPAELAAEAETARTRDDLMAVARKLYEWRGEMTRERH